MFSKILIVGLLVGCSSSKKQRKPEDKKPEPQQTDNGDGGYNIDPRDQGADGGHAGGGSHFSTGGQTTVTEITEKKDHNQDQTKDTSQDQLTKNTSQNQTKDTSQNQLAKNSDQQLEKDKKGKTEPTDERLPSPKVFLKFSEKHGHLVPVLTLRDATAVNDVQIHRKSLDFGLDSKDFHTEITAVPSHGYSIKLKLQDRQCTNNEQIELAETNSFTMNCGL